MLADVKPVGVGLDVRLDVMSLPAAWDLSYLSLQLRYLVEQVENFLLLLVQLVLLHALSQLLVYSFQCVLVRVQLNLFYRDVSLLILQLGIHYI